MHLYESRTTHTITTAAAVVCPALGDVGSASITGVTQKWYVIAQYTRHIIPGMTILSIGGGGTDPNAIDRVIATFDPVKNVLAVVVFNPSATATETVTVDLSAFSSVAGPITRWATDASNNGERAKSSFFFSCAVNGRDTLVAAVGNDYICTILCALRVAGADKYTQYNDTVLAGTSFVATMKKASVQTFEIQGVKK